MVEHESRALLARIAAGPRPAGSVAEAEARRFCAECLKQAGFAVEERPFTYSAFPGTWGAPLAGMALVAIAIVTLAEIASRKTTVGVAMASATAALMLVGAAGWWTGRFGTRLVPFMRRSGVNLEARRGVPAVWLVAHLDSKSQPVSLLVRAAAVVGAIVGWVGAIIAWGGSLVAPIPRWPLIALLMLAGVSGLPLLISWVGTRSEGALDNASGVATILTAARLVDLAFPMGVVVTSAEEFGLAGARAWVRGKTPARAINCDGVDDRGTLTITTSGTGRDLWKSDRVRAVVGSVVRFRRSLPGVLLDSTAFSDCGWTVCTVSRGTLASLARVHTVSDTLAELSGTGVDEVSRMVASLAGAIIAEP